MSWQVHNPATGEVITEVPCMGSNEAKDAISSAYDAFKCKGVIASAPPSKPNPNNKERQDFLRS